MKLTHDTKVFLTAFLENCGEHDSVAEDLALTVVDLRLESDIEVRYDWRDNAGHLWQNCVAHGVRLGRFLLAWLDVSECGGNKVESATVVECDDLEEAEEILKDLIEQNTDNPEIGQTYYFEAIWGKKLS